MNGYYTRYYEPGDEKGIIKLLKKSFKIWPNIDVEPLSHWFWKYTENPYWKNDVVVALKGENIIGCKHSVYFNLKLGEKVIECSLGSDLAVHPDWRRKGISKKIREMSTFARTQIHSQDFSFYVSSNPLMISDFKSRSDTLTHDVKVFVKIEDVGLQLKLMPMQYPSLNKIGYKTLVYLNNFGNLFRKKLAKPVVKIASANTLDERMNIFWDKVSKKYDFIVVRDVKYLHWRYLDPRAGKFIILVAEEKTSISGYIAIHVNTKSEYPIGYVVDLLTYPNRSDIGYELLKEALKYFKKYNVNIITSLVIKGHPYEKILRRAGFIDSRKKLNLFLGRKGLLSQDKETLEIIKGSPSERIHLMYGDFDSLPVDYPQM